MAKETRFQKIKQIVEEEKNKKVRGEARLNSLEEERARILEQVKEEADIDASSVEEIEKYGEKLKEEIESEIEKMAQILAEEGIDV